MNTKLTPRQLIAIIGGILLLVGFFATRYFTAPNVDTSEDSVNRALYGTTVVTVDLVLLELAPQHTIQHLKAPPRTELSKPLPPTQAFGMMSGGGMTNAQLKLATLREAHRRKLIEKAYDYLRHSGIPVAGGQPLEQPDPNLLPLYVAITIEGGSGIVYDGEPTWRNLYYSVTFRRRLFSSAAATFPITAKLELAYPVSESLSGTVGPTSPETLEKRQEEALGKACEAIVAHWKYDNPAPNGKP